YHDQPPAARAELAEILALGELRHADDGAVHHQLARVAQAPGAAHGCLLDSARVPVEQAQDRVLLRAGLV
ncbi:hypothetical protein MYCTH_2039751, partial [Thermothelomyces thermophilus ATCC 42464]